jgi:ABC-type lipoprotein export system ATPase subunit
MITVSDLTFQYTPQAAIRFPDFTVKDGEHFLLLGDSGSGKTTLLHLLGGLLRQYRGSIKIDNIELSSLSEALLDRFRGQKIGFVFQRNHLIGALTVEKNLMMSPYLAGLPVERERIHHVLGTLGLQELWNRNVNALSHGQAQRVAIARAILNKPAIILADEPTSALDDKNCEKVIRLLMDVADQNQATLLVATHDQRLKDKIAKQIILKA